ncbi:hypothetical protein EYF80_039951 [Liparis tanakae]|uniref:Uncharacterized protein n=1 Tax=Liparis tanakae TaxID=230148 RepID=A0A4Z2G8P0_9TELE|nr:hypothetical protein EYF80_039951 [Liparis tanakae]
MARDVNQTVSPSPSGQSRHMCVTATHLEEEETQAPGGDYDGAPGLPTAVRRRPAPTRPTPTPPTPTPPTRETRPTPTGPTRTGPQILVSDPSTGFKFEPRRLI